MALPGWPAPASTATWRCAGRWRTSPRPSRSGRASSRSTTAIRPRSPSPPGTSHEVSGGRFRLGLGVSHAPSMHRLGIDTGKPLHDMSEYVAAIRGADARRRCSCRRSTWRRCATRCSTWRCRSPTARSGRTPRADTCRRRLPASNGRRPRHVLPGQHGADGHRRGPGRGPGRSTARTLAGYLALPNYRNYWKQAGYEEEMTAIEYGARRRRPRSTSRPHDRRVARRLHDQWLRRHDVREPLDDWMSLGVLPIAVMSSTTGGQAVAIGELFAATRADGAVV